jgi:hypothetical protein
MRILGLLLFWVGTAVAAVAALALGGVPVQIELLAFDLDTRQERIALAVAAVIVAVTGLVVLGLSRRSQNSGAPPAP